jgi:hypothetical protein
MFSLVHKFIDPNQRQQTKKNQRAVCTGTAPAVAPTAAASYVPNPYFSFPYAPATFTNSRACSSVLSQCSQNYGACVTQLQGGNRFPVTVAVLGGGGTTVSADQISAGTSATAICSSLSSLACPSFQDSQCTQFGPSNDAQSLGIGVSHLRAGLVITLLHILL